MQEGCLAYGFFMPAPGRQQQRKRAFYMRENLKSSAFGRTILTLIHFSLPLILSGILQQLYNWADAFIVGNVEGELALAAVGSTTTLINFYVNAITGFTLGLSILFAQKYGNGEHGSLSRILSSFSVFLGGIFLLLAGVGIGLTAPLLKLLHTTPDTIGLAEEYLRIIFAGIPFLAVYNVYSAALRGIGGQPGAFLFRPALLPGQCGSGHPVRSLLPLERGGRSHRNCVLPGGHDPFSHRLQRPEVSASALLPPRQAFSPGGPDRRNPFRLPAHAPVQRQLRGQA